MDLKKAIDLVKLELMMRDEPLKAYYLLRELKHKDEALAYSMVKHLFDSILYASIYADDDCKDYARIEPERFVKKANEIYPRYAWILTDMKMEKSKSILDLACYVGTVVLTAVSRGAIGTGVEMTKIAVEAAKERAKKFKLKAKFYQGDLMEFDKVKADTVCANEVIEHVPDPEIFINHVASLSTGWCYITTPNGPFDNGRGNSAHPMKEGPRGHVRVFSVNSLRDLIEKCGCEIAYIKGMPDHLIWCKFRRK